MLRIGQIGKEQKTIVQKYQQFLYRDINLILRNDIASEESFLEEYLKTYKGRAQRLQYHEACEAIEVLDDVLYDSFTSQPKKLYRKCNSRHIGTPYVGKVLFDQGYLSTCKTLHSLENVTTIDSEKNDLTIELEVPENIRSLEIGNDFLHSEDEILLDKGLMLSFTNNVNGIWQVNVSYP